MTVSFESKDGDEGKADSSRYIPRTYCPLCQVHQVNVCASRKRCVHNLWTQNLSMAGQADKKRVEEHLPTKSQSPKAPHSESPVTFKSQNSGTFTRG